jgi:predicted  nucleic acid-binding Zn-ribbon protein
MIEILDDKRSPVDQQKVKVTETKQVVETSFDGTLKDLQDEITILTNQKTKFNTEIDAVISAKQALVDQVQKELEKLPPRDLEDEYPKEPIEPLPEEIINR